jgi:hypothetical protein
MPIPLECACGRSLRVKDELAGRKVKCPQCGGVLAVPKPAAAEEDDEPRLIPLDDSEEESRPVEKKSRPNLKERVQTAPRPAGRRAPDEDEEDEDDDRSRREEVRRRREREEEREREAEREERRLLKQHRRESRRDATRHSQPRVSFERGWLGSMNAGIVGGLLMILIAIVWFVVGLAFGIIFFYPPILAVIGVIAIIKGAVDR